MENLKITQGQLAGMIDHTLLKAFAREEDFEKLCEEAKKYGFGTVVINSSAVRMCKGFLKESQVSIGAVISFPLGQTSIETKVFETKDAIANGADEIDYVINIVELKKKNHAYLEEEMRQIVEICRNHNVTSKVIFENCYLTEEEKETMCKIALKVLPDFIKTSTGFGTSGAAVEDVKLMKSIVGNQVKVKAAGGIRDLQAVLEMAEAGAERIGTSAGVKIMEEYFLRLK